VSAAGTINRGRDDSDAERDGDRYQTLGRAPGIELDRELRFVGEPSLVQDHAVPGIKSQLRANKRTELACVSEVRQLQRR
jgi:hypothetical protein